ncbi:glycoside hydrolase family 19 protein [Kaistia defluvii]|uniref:Chitinase n=1 Tax=Kaistia defluvii TaxID=410841 RepID=A0ABV2R108_9HYPH
MNRITADDLRRLTPYADSSLLAGLAPLLVEILPDYGITTPLRLAHFLAQAAHETAGFKTLVEYGSTAYFDKRYGPQTDVGKTLGNTQPGDGARFRGRGIFQCTGRFNYAKYGKLIGVDLIANPGQAANVANSVRIACEYWKAKGLNALADANNIEAITRKINGGTNGLKDRKAYLEKARAIMGGSTAPLPVPPPTPTADLPDAPIATDAPGSLLKSETVLGAGTTVIGSAGVGLLSAVENPYALVAFLVVLGAAGFLIWRAMKRRGLV